MTEAEFNAEFREILRVQGLQCFHIREADNPGALDLLVYRHESYEAFVWPHTILCWVELKVNDEPLRDSQRDFVKSQMAHPAGAPCFLARWQRGYLQLWKANTINAHGEIVWSQGLLTNPRYFGLDDWSHIFESWT